MWRPAQTVLDAAPTIWVLTLEDLGLGVAVFFGAGILGELEILTSLVCTAAVVTAVYWAKRGKPPGIILQRLHTWLYPWFRLPGVLPPHPTRYSPW